MFDDMIFEDDAQSMERSPSVETSPFHDVPLVQPLHGPTRYHKGSITVTHTSTSPYLGSQQQLRQCSEETLHVRGKTDMRIEKVVYAPYALYRCGNTYHYNSVGYSSGGDIVLLKDEISNGEIENEAFSLEGGKKYPGVKVVKGRRARERGKNTYLMTKVVEANGAGEVLDLFTPEKTPGRTSSFSDASGGVSDAFKKFVSITEEAQTQLLTKKTKLAPISHHDEAFARFARLSKDHATLLRSAVDNAVLMAVLEGLEPTVAAWLAGYDAGAVLSIALEEPCHRKMLHVVAEFYLLRSWSHSVGGDRICSVAPAKPQAAPVMPSESLCSFLKSGGATPMSLPHAYSDKKNRQ